MKALRPGGALGISWNTRVARREDAAGALADAGLEVLDSAPYRAFRHRVDQAITRDILVARKPALTGQGSEHSGSATCGPGHGSPGGTGDKVSCPAGPAREVLT